MHPQDARTHWKPDHVITNKQISWAVSRVFIRLNTTNTFQEFNQVFQTTDHRFMSNSHVTVITSLTWGLKIYHIQLKIRDRMNKHAYSNAGCCICIFA